MHKPIIYLVDEDPESLQSLTDHLASFKENFDLQGYTNPTELLNKIKEHPDLPVALFLVDNNLKKIDSIEFIQEASQHFPSAKNVLLTNINKNDETVKGFKDDHLDCYILKPFTPVEEKLLPVINDLLEQWEGVKKNDEQPEQLTIIGPRWSPMLHTIKDFLSRNLYPFQYFDIEKDPEAKEKLNEINLKEYNQPVVIFPDLSYKVNPDIKDIAENAGLNLSPDAQFYDLIIIGAGPAGLAASVNAASEGISTLVIEKDAPGGQAGSSSHIANYLGFPGGISGEELTKRAITQAEKFGVEILRASDVDKIEIKHGYKSIHLTNNQTVSCYCILLSTGVSYKKLNTPGLDKFSGAGVYYGGVNTEAPLCDGQTVCIIGGGNSAGQAAMYLSHYAHKVIVLVIEEDLHQTMSQYLIEQIKNTPNIEVLTNTVVEKAFGEKKLEKIFISNKSTGKSNELETSALFIYIGGEPRTKWLPPSLLRDEKGFIVTGFDLMNNGKKKDFWKLKRYPGLLETSVPGIFAAGDVRKGSVKRVASAVGEGSMVVTNVHQYLNQFKL